MWTENDFSGIQYARNKGYDIQQHRPSERDAIVLKAGHCGNTQPTVLKMPFTQISKGQKSTKPRFIWMNMQKSMITIVPARPSKAIPGPCKHVVAFLLAILNSSSDYRKERKTASKPAAIANKSSDYDVEQTKRLLDVLQFELLEENNLFDRVPIKWNIRWSCPTCAMANTTA